MCKIVSGDLLTVVPKKQFKVYFSAERTYYTWMNLSLFSLVFAVDFLKINMVFGGILFGCGLCVLSRGTELFIMRHRKITRGDENGYKDRQGIVVIAYCFIIVFCVSFLLIVFN
jgi:uncharacterized membrane protein YidH (DUF202 family)